jgi:putative PEP-CTERM system TPR-repeat lipoprotein
MTRIFFVGAALLILAASTLPALADAQKAQTYIQDARKMQQKGDVRAAVIQLKNAVQADPDNGEARLELGIAELRIGDAASAEKELRAARARKVEEERIAPSLAQALLRQRKYQELLDDVPAGKRSAAAEAEIRLDRGYALLALKRRQEAGQAMEEAVALMPKPGARAQLGLAEVKVANGDLDAAGAIVQQAVAAQPDFAAGWLLAARIDETLGRKEEARKKLDKVLELDPGNLEARTIRASLLGDAGQLDRAQADIATVLKAHPADPGANFVQATLQVRRKEYRAVETSLQKIGNLADFPRGLYLLATANLALGEVVQAEEHMGRYHTLLPDDALGAAFYANILLTRGNAQKAIEVLKPAVARHADNAELLSLLSGAYIRDGQNDKAAALLDRLSALAGHKAGVHDAIAWQRLQLGEANAALSQLDQAAPGGADRPETAILRVFALLQAGKQKEAIAALEDLKKERPKDPAIPNMVGNLLAKHDASAARVNYRAALALQPDFRPALLGMAQLDLAIGKRDEARAVYDGILKHDPVALDALMGQARISIAENRLDDGILWLEKARNGNPRSVEARLALAGAYLRRKEAARAVTIAQEASLIAPRDPRVLDMLAQAQIANGDARAAVGSARHLVEAAPRSAQAELRLADAALAAKDEAAAHAAFGSALALAPDQATVQSAFVSYATRSGSTDWAVGHMRELIAKQPDNPNLYAVLGDLLTATGKYPEAIAAYSDGLKSKADPMLAVRLARAYLEAGDGPKAVALLQDWVKRDGGDLHLRQALAETYTGLHRDDEAEGEYQKLLDNDPGNVAALNNLAVIYAAKGNKERAQSFAEKAYAIAGSSPAVADTLGWILVQGGNNDRGMTVLSKAAAAAPDDPDIAYHFAVALKNAGKTAEARRVIEPAVKSGKKFQDSNDARRLSTELGG